MTGARCTATIHPADAVLRGRRKLWALGVAGLVATLARLGVDDSPATVRKAIARGDFDPLDPLDVAAWLCSRAGEHWIADRLRKLGDRTMTP